MNKKINDEVLRIQNLMGIKVSYRGYVIKRANEMITNLNRDKKDWRDKSKIIGFLLMIITGASSDQETGAKKLKSLLIEKPELCEYYFKVSKTLKMAAILSRKPSPPNRNEFYRNMK